MRIDSHGKQGAGRGATAEMKIAVPETRPAPHEEGNGLEVNLRLKLDRARAEFG